MSNFLTARPTDKSPTVSNPGTRSNIVRPHDEMSDRRSQRYPQCQCRAGGTGIGGEILGQAVGRIQYVGDPEIGES